MKRPHFVPTMVLLGAVAVCAPAVAQQAIAPPTEIEVAPVERLSKSAPFPVGWEDDVYCTGWIGADGDPVTGRIVAAEYEDSRTMYATGDIVYADAGAADGLIAGQMFQVIRPAHTVYRTGSAIDTIGRFYDTPGRVKVVCVQEKTAILEFTESCSPAQVGDLLVPFEPIPIPLVRQSPPYTQCDPPSGKTTGRIVEVKDRAVPVGTDSVVFLDLGEADGLFPGDFMTVWRPRADASLGLRTLLGEVAVLWTKDRTCVAKVTSMVDAMGVGDFVELK